MIRYRPRFRNPDKAARPVDLADAEKLPPGVNPLSAHPAELMLDVETPDGKTIAIDDPTLIGHLPTNIEENHQLTLRRSDQSMPHCPPVSTFFVQSAEKLGEEVGTTGYQCRSGAN